MDDTGNVVERSPEIIAARQRFAHLPAGLCDLAHLARGRRNPGAPGESVADGERNATEGVPYRRSKGMESVPDGERNGTESVLDGERNDAQGEADEPRNTGAPGESVPYRHRNGNATVPERGGNGADATPISTVFEQRCAEAFRCLGFEVRELGQGCGRTADCLAVAVAERFAVIIDAKVRRKGYTLGTDDRQFCEYATRHYHELAQAGIERVYFAVIGHGFRQADLDKLAGFMTGTPIRSVVFIEAEALMRLVDQSIHKRREFRLAEIDQLLFGNKIVVR